MSERTDAPSGQTALEAKPLVSPGMHLLSDLKVGLSRKYKRRRDGIHISDLAMCPRQVVFRDITPMTLNNRELNNFTSGSAIGAAIEGLTTDRPEKYTTEQFCSLGHFINGHIDIYDKESNIPVEFKTYRGRDSKYLPKIHQIDQLKSYMAAMDADLGLLMYQLLLKFEGDPFIVYEIRMTAAEREEWKKAKIADGLQLATARAYGKPELARHVMNDASMKWLCEDCPFLDRCKEINKQMEGQL
jgi:hypothetical protein